MGSKTAAPPGRDCRRRAGRAGHRPTPLGAEVSDAEVLQIAERRRLPADAESRFGRRRQGHARGRRTPDELPGALRAARSEAGSAFGDSAVYLERRIMRPRHIEVQLLADQHGTVVPFVERECSIQRRHQKVIEESPSLAVSPDLRRRITSAARSVARQVGLHQRRHHRVPPDGSGALYFTEIKPRIQSNHLITEMVSGVDIVREQIRLAAGEPLSLRQDDVHLDGHALSSQISAEDPWTNYLPSPGTMRRVRLPGGPGIRVDTYIYSGCEVPSLYDPAIAKVAAWGSDRDSAVARLRRALEDLALVGTSTNLPLLQRILAAERFAAGDYNTAFLQHPFEIEEPPAPYLRDLAAIAAVLYLRRNQMFEPEVPERFRLAWHRHSRRLPS